MSRKVTRGYYGVQYKLPKPPHNPKISFKSASPKAGKLAAWKQIINNGRRSRRHNMSKTRKRASKQNARTKTHRSASKQRKTCPQPHPNKRPQPQETSKSKQQPPVPAATRLLGNTLPKGACGREHRAARRRDGARSDEAAGRTTGRAGEGGEKEPAGPEGERQEDQPNPTALAASAECKHPIAG
jgi:hypothetical protein